MSTQDPNLDQVKEVDVLSRQLLICLADGQFIAEISPSEISDLIQRKNHFVWLDIQNPQAEDIDLLREEFNFHPLALEDVIRPHQRPKLDAYDSYYFIVFYAIDYDDQQQKLEIEAINLFIGSNYLVSVHEGSIPSIADTIRRWQGNQEDFGHDTGALLYALLDAIVDDYFPIIDRMADRVDALEEQIFERFREDVLQEVFDLKRDLLTMRRIVAPERDVLNVLIRRDVPILQRNTVLYFQDVYDHIVRITDSIDTYRDLLSSALDAFLSVQSNRLNQVVKVLTIASIVLMSNSLIAGIYGMNFEFMPELHWKLGYPFALGLMLLISSGLILFFRKQKWL